MKDTSKGSGSPHLKIVGAGADPSSGAPTSVPTFTVRVRGLHQLAHDAVDVPGASIEKAVMAALALDVSSMVEPVISWRDQRELVALDIDRAGVAPPLADEEIPSLFPDWLPRPLAAWPTHDGGLRALFCSVDGNSALALAGAWHIGAPLGRIAGWSVQPKTDGRHPKGLRDGKRCGQVFTFATSAHFSFPSQHVAVDASDDGVQAWLVEHGLTQGRHGPEACPWCGHRPSSTNACVVVDDEGVRCFRCQTWRSWPSLLSDRSGLGELEVAAFNVVHWPHQRLVLQHLRPSTPEELQRPAWAFMLRHANQDRLAIDRDGAWADRIARASGGTIDIVRSSSGTWLSARTLQTRHVSADRTLKELPWALSRTRVDQALSTETLEGFIPIEPIGASVLLAPGHVSSGVVVRRPPGPGEPPAPDVGAEPPIQERVDKAWSTLVERFPGLNRNYLTALLLAILDAQQAVSTPPMIAVTGLPGTSKTATVHLAAGMVGASVGDVTLSDAEVTTRQIGLCLESGASPLLFDEVGRARQVYDRLQTILRLNSTTFFSAKYRNESTVSVKAPVVLAGSTLPRAVIGSPELDRRAVGYLLTEKAPDWDRHGEIARLRVDADMRKELDVITADVWWKLKLAGPGFNFRRHCLEYLGAMSLGDLDSDGASPEGRVAVIRFLYEAFRTAPASQLTTGSSWRGWLDCTPGTPNGQQLGELVDFAGDDRGLFADTEELKRLDLAGILRIQGPRLRLLVHRRGTRWLVKFEEHGVARGKGRRREDLPPLGGAAPERPADDTAHAAPVPGVADVGDDPEETRL